MNLTFKQKHIVPELKSTTGLEAIGELVAHLVSVGTISPETAAPIAQVVKQRESSMSTGCGFGIAIPHGSTPLTSEILLAFGRSPQGIDFEALDNQPVRLVVLVVVPAREKEKNFLTLARISRLLHAKDIRTALENALDADSISSILNGAQLLAA